MEQITPPTDDSHLYDSIVLKVDGFVPLGEAVADAEMAVVESRFGVYDVEQKMEQGLVSLNSVNELKAELEGDEEIKSHHIWAIREVFYFLGQDTDKAVNAYNRWFDEHAPEFLSMQVPESSGSRNWVEWFSAKKGGVEAVESATDEQVVNFAQWHSDYIRKLTSEPESQARISELRQRYEAGIQVAVQEGYLGEVSIYDANSVEAANILVGDIFATSIGSRANGYYLHATDEVVLSPDYDDITAFHEFGHARMGAFQARIFDEFCAEFIAKGVEEGGFDKIDYTRLEACEDEGLIVFALIHKDNRVGLSVKDFTRAWSSGDSTELEAKLMTALPGFSNGRDVIEYVGALFDSTYNVAKQGGMSHQDAKEEASVVVCEAIMEWEAKPVEAN